MNERFTNLADIVSQGMGQWWVTAFSILIVLAWLASGPFFHWSDTWQLLVNTPTTILEMWIGFLLAAAANRSERHTKDMLEQIIELNKQIKEENEEELRSLTNKNLV